VVFSAWVILTATFIIGLALGKPSAPETGNMNGSTPNPPGRETEDQRIWLVVEGVDAYEIENAVVKVVANVNGTKYVYPTLEGIEWMEVGPSMAPQKFLLPKANKYEISFSMKVRQGNRVRDFVSVEKISVKATDAKSFSSQYDLHSKDGGVRAASVSAAVRFKLSQNPN
jgi:hypothetical protein